MTANYPKVLDFPLAIRPSVALDYETSNNDKKPERFSLSRLFSSRINLDDANTGYEIMAGGGNAEDLKKRGYSSEKLRTEGVTMGKFLYYSFGIRDLVYLGFSWDNLVEIGLRANEMRRENNMFIPEVLHRQLGVTIPELQRIGFTIDHLLGLKCTVDELYVLGCRANTLFELGMTVEAFHQFKFTLPEWRQYLELTKEHVTEQLHFQKEDFRAMNWGIMELEKSLQFTSRELSEMGMGMKMPTSFVFSRKAASGKMM